jgi:hypothetical protein
MTIQLPAEDRMAIAEQHMKNVLYAEYGAQLTLSEAQAISVPNQKNIDATTEQLKDISAQKAVLQSEIDSINAEIAAADAPAPSTTTTSKTK